MNVPLISVIVPAYNVAPYIERCIESIINQTYKNLEIIIINDGSTDNTGTIIDCYAKADKRIKIIHKANTGVSSTRNTGIEFATGEYIGFVDGDDTICEDMYEFLYSNIDKYGADISHCGYKIVRPNKEDVIIHGTGEIRIQDKNQGIIDLLQGTIVEPGVWNKLFKKEIFENVLFDTNQKILEDLLLNIIVFLKSSKSVFIDIPKYNYIIREGSTCTTSDKLVKELESVVVSEKICNKLEGDNFLLDYAKAYQLRAYINYCKSIIFESKDRDKIMCSIVKLREIKNLISNNSVITTRDLILIFLITNMPYIFRIMYLIYDKLNSKRYFYKVG